MTGRPCAASTRLQGGAVHAASGRHDYKDKKREERLAAALRENLGAARRSPAEIGRSGEG